MKRKMTVKEPPSSLLSGGGGGGPPPTITPPCSPPGEIEEGELLDDVQDLDEIR